MPSRLGTIVIVVFWLACTSWMFVREILPRFRTGEPPIFFTDVTAEMGGTTANWNIFHKGKNIGIGLSQVRRLGYKEDPDAKRTFEFSSDMKFENLRLVGIKIRRLQSSYTVTMDGRLLSLKAVAKVGEELDMIRKGPGGIELVREPKCEITGKVTGGKLLMKAAITLPPLDTIVHEFDSLDVTKHKSVLNTMHLIDKVPGLRPGQSWQIPLFDPLDGVFAVPNTMSIPLLIAEVDVDRLDWQGHSVSCYRIDYFEPGKKATARTWVRRADDLVLQQEAKHGDLDLVLVREVSK